jgi:hypothetical protein
MLAAAEAAMDMAAEDDAERQRIRAKLYAPPRGERARGARGRPAAARVDAGQARALMAQVAAEDAQLASRRSG